MNDWQKLRRLYINALYMTGDTDSVVCQNIGRTMIERGFGNHFQRLIREIGQIQRDTIGFMVEGLKCERTMAEVDGRPSIIENERLRRR